MKGWLIVSLVLALLVLVTPISKIVGEFQKYQQFAKPAIESVGFTEINPENLSRALNPCIVDGELPDVCKKYVKNGVVTQPPIKIVVDETK